MMEVKERTTRHVARNNSAIGIEQSINWDIAVTFCKGNEALAQELLDMLIASIPDLRKAIVTTLEKHDYLTLSRKAHYLHGACVCCGVPRLTQSLASLDHAFNTGDAAAIPSLVKKIVFELDGVMQCYEADNYRVAQ